MTKPVPRLKEITPAQCRAARGLLGWTQKDLADRSGVSTPTVVGFERGENRPQAATLAKLVACLERAGITFRDEPGWVGQGPG